MVLVIALVVLCWVVLPLPFAVAVGRAFAAGGRGAGDPVREQGSTPGAPAPAGDLAA